MSCKKRALRMVFNVERDTPSSELFLNARLLNVEQLVFYCVAVLMFKILNGLSAPYFSNLFVFHDNGRALRSKSLNLLHIPYASHQLGFKALRCSGARVWNSLLSNIRECKRLDIFKHLCETYLLKCDQFIA